MRLKEEIMCSYLREKERGVYVFRNDKDLIVCFSEAAKKNMKEYSCIKR